MKYFYLLFGIIILYFIFQKKNQEGYREKLLFEDPFTKLYMEHYDSITFSQKKFDYEISIIEKYLKKSIMFKKTKILDIGCGTGNHTAHLNNEGYNTIGLDSSKDAVDYCINIYRHEDWFKHGNVLKPPLFRNREFSHILCLNYTIYYVKQKAELFQNCYKWLKNGGYLFLHVIDNAEKLYLETDGWVELDNNSKYRSRIDIDKDTTYLYEKIKTSDYTLSNVHTLHHLGNRDKIVDIAIKTGFKIEKKLKIKTKGYHHHYIYVLKR